jgi:hypothetical protein
MHSSYTLQKFVAHIQIVDIFLVTMYKSLIAKIITEAENPGKQ